MLHVLQTINMVANYMYLGQNISSQVFIFPEFQFLQSKNLF